MRCHVVKPGTSCWESWGKPGKLEHFLKKTRKFFGWKTYGKLWENQEVLGKTRKSLDNFTKGNAR